MVDELKKNNHEVISYVIMPNHFHAILYFPQAGYDPNKIISNCKRLIAYEIIDRLKNQKENSLLELLSAAVTEREKNKGQLHRVFEESFDTKPVYSQNSFMHKFNYVITIPLAANEI